MFVKQQKNLQKKLDRFDRSNKTENNEKYKNATSKTNQKEELKMYTTKVRSWNKQMF